MDVDTFQHCIILFLVLGENVGEIREKMIKMIHSFDSKYKKKIYFNYNYNIISI